MAMLQFSEGEGPPDVTSPKKTKYTVQCKICSWWPAPGYAFGGKNFGKPCSWLYAWCVG